MLQNKLIIFLGIILLVLCLVFIMNKVTFNQSRVVKITGLKGDVKAITANGTKTIDAFKNMRLLQGDKLLTGEKAWVSLRIDSDKEVLVSESTTLSIDELAGTKKDFITVLSLESGKVWTNIKEKLNRNSKYEVKTPTATMGVRGTGFYVNASKETTKLAVLNGTVSASTAITTEDMEGKIKTEEVTLLINKNKQVSIEKDQITTKEELSNKIRDVNISSFDLEILKFIHRSSVGIDQEIYDEISEYLRLKKMEAVLVKEGKVQIKGTVFLPNRYKNEEGGHFHIRNSNNNWISFGLLNENGDFVVGDLSDGSYWLRCDPALVDEYSRSDEVPFIISNGKANPDQINVNLNSIQFSGSIVDPKGLPVSEGYLYIKDATGNWIYYAEIENAVNVIYVGGLPDGFYQVIAYPASNSEFVPSDARGLTIANNNADSKNIVLSLNSPQFSGKVLLLDGKTAAAGGHVHVRDETGQWVQYVNLDKSGSFKVGGLREGNYWLRADSSEDPGYASSKELLVNIAGGKATPSSPQLIINK